MDLTKEGLHCGICGMMLIFFKGDDDTYMDIQCDHKLDDADFFICGRDDCEHDVHHPGN